MGTASDELADRIRNMIGHKPGVTEKRMFGGYGFMLNGNMICGAMAKGFLLLRVGADLHAEAVKRPGAQSMNHGGRDMIGFVEVTDDIENDDGLKGWLDFAWNFVKTLPPKVEKPKAITKKAGVKSPTKKVAAKAPAKKSIASATAKRRPAKKAAKH